MYYNNLPTNFESKFNEPYINQTRKYLTPVFLYYGDEFIQHMKNNTLLMTGIQDYGVNKSSASRQLIPQIYFLFDVNGPSTFGHYANTRKSRIVFSQSLNYFQNHTSYVTDYAYDSNLNGHLHVVILKIPEIHHPKFHLFLEGKYSKMYSKEEIEKLFVKDVEVDSVKDKKVVRVRMLTDQYCVVNHVSEYFDVFKDKVYTEFGTRLTEDDGREYDFPPFMKNEILRYSTATTETIQSLTI